MANIFQLNQEQEEIVSLLENESNLSGEEKIDLHKRLAVIYEKKGVALLPLFDIIEYLVMQNNHAEEKIEEIRNKVKRNKRVIDSLKGVVKGIFISTGQKLFQVTQTLAFKRRKLPKRIEIDETAIDNIPDDFKTVTLTVPVSIARIISLDFPQLKLDIDTKKQEVSKIELKKLIESGVEIEGVKLIDDDFTVVKDGV